MKIRMSKNNNLINAMKVLAGRKRAEAVSKAADDIVPQVYAAIAIALHREYGWGYTRINRAFARSQEIWESFNGRMDEMVKMCEEETGISLELGGKNG